MVQKTQWSIWESIRLKILGPRFNFHHSFGQWLKVLANLTDLTNLFSRDLGKTPMTGIAIEITNFSLFQSFFYLSQKELCKGKPRY